MKGTVSQHPSTVPPSSIKRHDKSVSRVHTAVLRPQQPSPHLPGEQISIDIPGQGLFDCERHTLDFEVTSTSGSTRFYLDGSGHSFIKRVQVVSRSGAYIEDSAEYNLMANMFSQVTIGPDYCAKAWVQGLDNLNAATLTDKILIDTTAKRFSIPLDIPLFKSTRFLHMMALGGLKLMIELAPVRDVCASYHASDTAPTGYNVSNVRLHTRSLLMSNEFDNIVRRQAAAGGIIYNPLAYMVRSKQTTGTNSNALSISGNQLSVEKVFTVRRIAGDMSSTLVQQSGENGQYTLTRYVHPSTTSSEALQFHHGAERYPAQPIDESEVADFYLQQAVNLHGDVNCESHLTRARYTTQATVGTAAGANNYVTGYEFSTAGRNSGVDITINDLQLVEEVTADPIASGSQYDALVFFSAAIQVKSPTEIRVAV